MRAFGIPELLGLACCFVTACVVSGGGGAAAQTAAPVLHFSDIIGGPKSGNSDNSRGQVAGQDGAIVTLWGRNLDNAEVYCNGARAAVYYSRGNATQPANLYAFHRMQMIAFQVSHLATNGAGWIYVLANGRQSNSLPFTVRAGGIRFVKTTGNDTTGNGSWTQPWRTIVKATDTIAPGDIAYICDGVNQTTETNYGAAVNLGSDGTSTGPKALVVYPGATSRVGATTIARAFFLQQADTDGFTSHWVLAKFRLTASEICAPAYTGFRVVGNYITAPTGDGMDGAINGEGNNVCALGNELDHVGSGSCSKLYHAIYFKGFRKDEPPRAPTESNREIAWNYLHDCLTNRGINIYSEQLNSAYIQGHSVHNNVIVNQRGDGIMLGYYVIGTNSVYNNLIIRAGQGPEWVDDASYHTGIHIQTGHENIPKSGTIINIYNNTLYGCGWSGAVYTEENGHLLIAPEALSSSTINFSNNAVYSTGNPYVALESGTLTSGNHRNCWFGTGAAPAWDTGAINSNPLFVNAAGNDLQLRAVSPCVNTGRNLSPVVTRDLLGASRPWGTAYDLGAYEYYPPPAGAAQWMKYETLERSNRMWQDTE